MESNFLKECDEAIQNMNRRLFLVLGVTACASNTLGFIANVIAHGWTRDSVLFGVSAVIMYLLFYFGRKRDKMPRMSFWMIVLSTLIEFPIMCYLYGHSRTVFCVFGVAVYVFFLRRPVREVFLLLSLLLNSAALVLRELYPAYTAAETKSVAFMTMLLSTLIVMMVTFALLIVIRNMIDLQKDNIMEFGAQLEDALIHDALTGAYNRQYMYSTFRMLKRSGDVVAVLLDIDDFKLINDTRGHVFGDQVLVAFSHALMQATNACGTVFRFGGEEFLILFGKIPAPEALRITQDACAEFRTQVIASHQTVITCSGGLAVCSEGDGLETALKTADARLYYAKNTGKNRIVSEGEDLPPAPGRINRLS